MKRISTHILDLALGKPASDVAVRLEKQEGQRPSGWRLLASQRTDQDGRCGQLLPAGEDLSAGYYAAQKVDALYPVVEVTFRVKDGETQFHIPLLLNRHGYTTYRGG
jgi:5-hydroxyisourate hydrolase